MTETFVGIDYSMSSPALCVGHKDAPLEEVTLHCFGNKKQQGMTTGFLKVHPKMDHASPEQRFAQLADWVVSNLPSTVEKVLIEGYSYGSSGTVFQIGENTGVLKHSLWMAGINIDVVAPPSVKKFATGAGNADKHQMVEAFHKETGFDLVNHFEASDRKTIPAPITDLVDAFWIWRMAQQ